MCHLLYSSSRKALSCICAVTLGRLTSTSIWVRAMHSSRNWRISSASPGATSWKTYIVTLINQYFQISFNHHLTQHYTHKYIKESLLTYTNSHNDLNKDTKTHTHMHIHTHTHTRTFSVLGVLVSALDKSSLSEKHFLLVKGPDS